LQQEYINIRMNSKYPFAFQIASLYGGGGHPDRAGFDVPDHVKHYLDKQISPIQIPSEFIAEILTYFQQLAEEEKKQ
jgi:nanoRNase/pAp phosphatase (c-di-AMP/oligoRNAs hydrolase)